MNTDKLFNAIGFAPQDSGAFHDAPAVFSYFANLCEANMLLSAAGLIPGYWTAFFLIDLPKCGRKRIQYFGFIMLTVLFLVMGKHMDTPECIMY